MLSVELRWHLLKNISGKRPCGSRRLDFERCEKKQLPIPAIVSEANKGVCDQQTEKKKRKRKEEDGVRQDAE